MLDLYPDTDWPASPLYTLPENKPAIPDGRLFELTEPITTLYEDGALIVNFDRPLDARQATRFVKMIRVRILSVKTCEKQLTCYTGTSFAITFRLFDQLDTDRAAIRKIAADFLEWEPTIPVQVSLF